MSIKYYPTIIHSGPEMLNGPLQMRFLTESIKNLPMFSIAVFLDIPLNCIENKHINTFVF